MTRVIQANEWLIREVEETKRPMIIRGIYSKKDVNDTSKKERKMQSKFGDFSECDVSAIN